jgi:hypothetical protein
MNSMRSKPRRRARSAPEEPAPRDARAHAAAAKARAGYLGGLPENCTGIDLDHAAAELRALIAQQDRP